MRISHSMKETFLQCSQKYKLHYKDKLRSIYIDSPLFFGSAIDESLNVLLATKMDNPETFEHTCEETFIKHMKHTNVNGEKIDLSKSLQARYFKSDYDFSVITESQCLDIMKFAESQTIYFNDTNDVDKFMLECFEIMKNKAILGESEQLVFNNICWNSLVSKGLLMIETYRTEVIPLINKVYSIQKKISLKDGQHELTGIIDFICSFTDDPDTKYIVDNKTTSKAYKEDSVVTSDQLSTYAESEMINHCAYIVMVKTLRKKQPRVRVQIIKDVINEEQIDKTFDVLGDVFQQMVDNEISMVYHEKGDSSCFHFGRKCQYFDYCRNGSLDGLVRKK